MTRSYVSAIGIGIIAGIRSLAAPALISRYLHDEDEERLGALGRVITSPVVSRVLQAGATAEMAADKSARIPDRTAFPSLAWRAVVGAVAGAVVAGAEGDRPMIGAVLGSASAVGATYGAFYLRRALGRRLHVSDRLLGAAEDALVVAGGRRLLTSAA